ncbi:MAG: hypothetical protein ACERIH_10465 [Labilibaculum antarcticum]
MNKIFKIFIFATLILLSYCCGNIRKSINIKQFNVDYPLIIRLSKENTVIRLQFPKKIIIENKSFFKRDFVEIEYDYKNMPLGRDLRIGLFEKVNGKLTKVSNNKMKTISAKGSLEFVYYTRHFVDSTKAIQQQFKPYIEKMLRLKKDTLHIGTVVKFKKKHKELFESLTKNDSISIRFLDSGTKSGLGERIAVPVKW